MRPVSPAMKVFLPCLALIAGLLAYAQAATAGTLSPNVLVTVAPLKPLADALLQNIAISAALPHQGQDAHSMQLSPSQLRAIAGADIIIMPDAQMNNALHQLIAEHAPQGARIISLTDLPGAEPLPYPAAQPWLGEEKEPESANDSAAAAPVDKREADAPDDLDQLVQQASATGPAAAKIVTPETDIHAEEETEKPPRDPHLWLDPLRMATLAPALAEAMAEQAPSQRARLLYNAQTLARHLRQEVHPALRAMLQSPMARAGARKRAEIPFVSSHQSYQYFLARYGIANPGALANIPESAMGARSKHDLLKRAGEVHIGCVLAEHAGPLERRVAQSSGARLVALSPEYAVAEPPIPPLAWIRNDYDRLLYVTARALADCLGK